MKIQYMLIKCGIENYDHISMFASISERYTEHGPD